MAEDAFKIISLNGDCRRRRIRGPRDPDRGRPPHRMRHDHSGNGALRAHRGPAAHRLACRLVARDPQGYLLTGQLAAAIDAAPAWPLERSPMLLETSVPGVFAAGDVRSRSVKGWQQRWAKVPPPSA